MIIGLFSCANTPSESLMEKLTGIDIFSSLESCLCDTFISDQAYLFMVELVSLPLVKPYEIFFSVWSVILVSLTSLEIVPFLEVRFFGFGSLREGLLFPIDPSMSFTTCLIRLGFLFLLS